MTVFVQLKMNNLAHPVFWIQLDLTEIDDIPLSGMMIALRGMDLSDRIAAADENMEQNWFQHGDADIVRLRIAGGQVGGCSIVVVIDIGILEVEKEVGDHFRMTVVAVSDMVV